MKRDGSHLLDAAVPLLAGAIIAVGVAVRADAATRPLALTLGLAAAAALMLRRRAPAATLAVSGGFVLALFAIDDAAAAIAVIAPATALYSLALTRGRIHRSVRLPRRRRSWSPTPSSPAATPHSVTLQTAAHVGLVAVPLLAAEALRNRRSYVQLLRERLELAERTREEEAQRRAEQERLRIARDLHDVVARTLTTINVQAGVAARLLGRDPGLAQSALATIEAASHEALDELRTILGVLREPDGADAPLQPAPGLESVSELVVRTRDMGVDVSYHVDGRRRERVPDAVQLAAFRIVQESLTNARRHAPGAAARVSLSYTRDRLLVTVENGTSVVRNGHGGVRGVGILGMRERATALGGTLTASSSAHGFRVAAELPYRRSA